MFASYYHEVEETLKHPPPPQKKKTLHCVTKVMTPLVYLHPFWNCSFKLQNLKLCAILRYSDCPLYQHVLRAECSEQENDTRRKPSEILHNMVVTKSERKVVSFDARKKLTRVRLSLRRLVFSYVLHNTQRVLFCIKLCSLKLLV